MAWRGVYRGGFEPCGEGRGEEENGRLWWRVERFDHSRRRGNMRITGAVKGSCVYMEGVVALIPSRMSVASASKTVWGPPPLPPSPTCHPSCFSPPATPTLHRHIPSPPPSPSLDKPPPPLLSSFSQPPTPTDLSRRMPRLSPEKEKPVRTHNSQPLNDVWCRVRKNNNSRRPHPSREQAQIPSMYFEASSPAAP